MKRIKVSPEAREEIRGAVAWWKTNRPKGPHLLRDELRGAFTLLAAHPLAGHAAPGAPASSGIRFLLLRGSRFLVYYSVHEEDVEVLRFWHTSRGTRPFNA